MIAALYAPPLVLLLFVLTMQVVSRRKSRAISLGDGGDPALLARIRAHGNCAEYAPLGLLLMVVAELSGAAPAVVHLSGLALVAGRLLHAWALAWRGPFAARAGGMVLTLTSLVLSSLAGLVGVLAA
ncbi:MAPEG family protein [Frigidibacter oleivorans]|uniref:MAPEG family protein n=1 Tax=Frigidibacter oleivorans TaxID=2487129 RepID=UPI000F8E5023|nr:MAPEG family protein [Frigidibacter oleivorans]